jgi:hypothetical protein
MAVTAPETARIAGGQGRQMSLVTANTFWVASGLFIIVLFALAKASAAVMISFAVFAAMGLAWTRMLDGTSARLFMVVYGSSALAAVLLHEYYASLYGVPYFLGGSDEVHYEEMGKAFAESLDPLDYPGIRRTLVSPFHNSVAYIYIVGLLFKFASLFDGEHTMIPRLFNGLSLGLLSVGVYRLGQRLGLEKRIALVAGLFSGCMPLMMLIAVQTLRDIIVSTLLVGLVIVWTPRAGKRQSLLAALLLTVVIVVALIDLRRAHAFAALVVAGVGFLLTDVGQRPLVRACLVSIALGGGLAAYVILASFINSDVLVLLAQAEYYSDYRVEEVGGGLSTVVFTTPAPLGWLLRVGYALVSPLPEASMELDKIWASLGTIVQIFFIPFLFAGLGTAARQRSWLVVLSAMILLFIGMAIFTFTGRHIAQYMPFAILLTALGYQHYRHRRLILFAVMAGVGGVLAVVYVLLKL